MKAQVKPSGIIISGLLFVFIIIGLIYFYSGTMVSNGLEVPTEVTNASQEIQILNNEMAVIAGEVENTANNKTTAISSWCRTLLGDHIFCSGISVIDITFKMPSIMKGSISFVKGVDTPFNIPENLWAIIILIVTVVIVFAIISAWRRYTT